MHLEPGQTWSRVGWEFEQRDGFYIVWSLGNGTKRFEERVAGVFTIPDAPKPEPVAPVDAAPAQTMKQAIMQREWQDDLRRERSHNDTYSREK